MQTSQPTFLYSCTPSQTVFQYFKPIVSVRPECCSTETRTDEALRNPIILAKIFEKLPTKLLLSSCSLVNKIWNREARKFIRDVRKCTFRTFRDKSLCQAIRQMSFACSGITQAGRVIPLNSCKLDSTFRLKCEEDFSIEEAFDSMGEFKLRFLYMDVVMQREGTVCHDHEPLLWLLRRQGSQLEALEIRAFTAELREAFRNTQWDPCFPKLEQVTISYCCSPSTAAAAGDHSEERAILKRWLNGASNLKRVFVDWKAGLEILPEAQFGLLKKLDFRFHRPNQDEILFRSILQRKPELEEISISQPSPHDQESLRQQFYGVLQELLATSNESIKTISLVATQPFPGQLACPPMANLTSFEITLGCSKFEQLCEFLASIAPWYRNMPRLGDLELLRFAHGQFLTEYRFKVSFKPTKGPCAQDLKKDGRIQRSRIQKMALTLHSYKGKKIELTLLKDSFPHLSCLELDVSGTVLERGTFNPFLDVPELWPHLEELRLLCTGIAKQDLDSHFCGIHEEEVALLRQEDDEYLASVHIVPGRPSLLTLPDLQKLRIYLNFKCLKGAQPLVSKVAQFVALKRLTNTDVSVFVQFDTLLCPYSLTPLAVLS